MATHWLPDFSKIAKDQAYTESKSPAGLMDEKVGKSWDRTELWSKERGWIVGLTGMTVNHAVGETF